MKAIIYSKYGPPEVARLTEVARPSPRDNEILLKVYSSTVNRTDSGFRSAEYFISRFWSGLFRPKHKILGCEFSGVVEEVGNGALVIINYGAKLIINIDFIIKIKEYPVSKKKND